MLIDCPHCFTLVVHKRLKEQMATARPNRTQEERT